jgi:hypothetical protein
MQVLRLAVQRPDSAPRVASKLSKHRAHVFLHHVRVHIFPCASKQRTACAQSLTLNETGTLGKSLY